MDEYLLTWQKYICLKHKTKNMLAKVLLKSEMRNGWPHSPLRMNTDGRNIR